MTKSPESQPDQNILTVHEADAYINAVADVFSQGTVVVPGVECIGQGKRPKDNPTLFTHGRVKLYDATDQQGVTVGYEVEANMLASRYETKISQVRLADNDTARPIITHVTRTIQAGSNKPEYKIAKFDDSGTRIAKSWLYGPPGTAEALFRTLTTDFKTQMDAKLAGKIDLQDRIEAHLRDAPDDPASRIGTGRKMGDLLLSALLRKR